MSELQRLNSGEKSVAINIMLSQQDFTCKKLQACTDIEPLIRHPGRRNTGLADVFLSARALS
jgi:hypothetical protein